MMFFESIIPSQQRQRCPNLCIKILFSKGQRIFCITFILVKSMKYYIYDNNEFMEAFLTQTEVLQTI